MRRKTKLMAILTLVVGLSSFFSPTLNSKVFAADDVIAPTLEAVEIDKSQLNLNGLLTIKVKGDDVGTGMAGGDVVLIGSNGNNVRGKLELLNPQTLSFAHKTSPFESYVIDSIELYDKAQNKAYFYAPEDYEVTYLSNSEYDNIGEISGDNRYLTAIEVSKYYTDVDTVIIASGDNTSPDALSAGPLAYSLNAPILLTTGGKDQLHPATSEELKNRPGVKKVIIMGGEKAISLQVERDLKAKYGSGVKRIAGNDRYQTAVLAGEYLKEVRGIPETVILASGIAFADALSAGSYASKEGFPILLTDGSTLTSDTLTYIKNSQIKSVIIVGGDKVVEEKVADALKSNKKVSRLSGANRSATSVKIADELFNGSNKAIIANGYSFTDALAAAPLAAMKSAPILLTETTLPIVIEKYLNNSPKNSLKHVTVVGGSAVVSDTVKKAMSEALLER